MAAWEGRVRCCGGWALAHKGPGLGLVGPGPGPGVLGPCLGGDGCLSGGSTGPGVGWVPS